MFLIAFIFKSAPKKKLWIKSMKQIICVGTRIYIDLHEKKNAM